MYEIPYIMHVTNEDCVLDSYLMFLFLIATGKGKCVVEKTEFTLRLPNGKKLIPAKRINKMVIKYPSKQYSIRYNYVCDTFFT